MSAAAPSPSTRCFHCGLAVEDSSQYWVKIFDTEQPMCCPGCQAVAQTIVDAGQSAYYRYRSEPALPATEAPALLASLQIYDHPNIQKSFVVADDSRQKTATLLLEGITCAACQWLIERRLRQLPGVIQLQLNYALQRLQISWDDQQTRLSTILHSIETIGYHALPFDQQRLHAGLEQQRKRQLREIGIAGVFGMQVMMLALGLYAGGFYGMETDMRLLLRGASLLLCLPIMLVAADSFFRNAWQQIRRRAWGMDVPVSLGILGAFIGSVYATLSDSGEVYFDAIGMFVFLLLSARHFELRARMQAAGANARLTAHKPSMATLVDADNGQLTPISLGEIQPGDILQVLPGEMIPVDAELLSPKAEIDESLLTGEPQALDKRRGADLLGGSLNLGNSLQIRAKRNEAESTFTQIARLSAQAAGKKPKLTQLADVIAAKFVVGILSIAAVVGCYWWLKGNPDWWLMSLTVLIVSCPCALSLATPTALTLANSQLAAQGMLLINPQSMETLASVQHLIFDKTGTLTEGRFQITASMFWHINAHRALQLAASLEQHSEHPLAKAFLGSGSMPDVASEISNVPGQGLEGVIAGKKYRIGNQSFIHEWHPSLPSVRAEFSIYLADEQQVLAAFALNDRLRNDAQSSIAELQQLGLNISLLSGDKQLAVQQLAEQLHISRYYAEHQPAQKLAVIDHLQQQQQRLAMIGDGINDGPAMAKATLAIAMGSGTRLAIQHADLVLINKPLSNLVYAVKLARKCRRIIQENFAWALAYNLLAIPAAAAGWLSPWMAALGMALSSAIVVANALRLTRPLVTKPSVTT